MDYKKIESDIKSAIRYGLSKTDSDIFQNITDRIQTLYEAPTGNMNELKKKNTKSKGNTFEVFCKLYLIALGFKEVYLLNEVPEELLKILGLTRRDVGIDLICINIDNEYCAVQCKYRVAPLRRPNVLSWKSLSTFYALCSRCNFKKHIIMTNCLYTRKFGHKDTKDYSICFKRFQNTSRSFWLKILGDVGNVLGSGEIKIDEMKIENFKDDDQKEIQNGEIKTEIQDIVKQEKLSNVEKLRELRLQYYLK